MKTVPSGVRVSVLQKAMNDLSKDRGLLLDVPDEVDAVTRAKLIASIQQEVLEIIEAPDRPSFLRVVLEEFGFVILEGMTITPEQRQKIKIKELGEDENYKPLMWHTDGGAVKLPAFSALFSDVSGPRRLSQTVISHVDDVFPSLITSADTMIQKLETIDAPDELQQAWMDARKKLQLVLSHKAKKQSNWDQVIHNVLNNFIRVLKLSTVEKHITKGENMAIINDSIVHAQTAGRVFLHQWETPQTLLISNKDGVIHCRKPVRRGKDPVGKLFAKAVRAT